MEKIISSPGLTYDDVLLLPGYSDFTRDDIDTSTKLTRNIRLHIPLVSSPMDTVTESALAIALAHVGGIGILHRNMTISDQVAHVTKVKEHGLAVGAAIGASKGFEERAEALIEANTDVILLDSAHGYASQVIDALTFIKKKFPNQEIIAGSVATYDGARALITAGADALRVGMGPGAICTTRVISGMGVPQVQAVLACHEAAKGSGVPIIADGGIKHSGDMVKALAAGASTVMMGSFFASCEEAPGEIISLSMEQVPARFKSILKKDKTRYKFKIYRGMGSVGAMQKGAAIKSEDEFHGKSYKDKVLVAEGVEGLVPVKGTVEEVINQAMGGIKSGMYYVGTCTIPEIQDKGQFTQITQASLLESHPHDILVTNPGENY